MTEGVPELCKRNLPERRIYLTRVQERKYMLWHVRLAFTVRVNVNPPSLKIKKKTFFGFDSCQKSNNRKPTSTRGESCEFAMLA